MQPEIAGIHPVADLFPMLPDDELKELAADIKARGLLHPIVIDDQKRIIDGRNRFAACQIAEVEPQYTIYDGDDPEGYALVVNIRRRNISKGQQAMVVAKAMRLNGVKKLNTRKAAEKYGMSNARFGQANTVLDYAPDEVDRIMATPPMQTLDGAYEIAKANKKAKSEEADELAALRTEAPDLADAVTEERLSFEDAVTQLDERREDQKRAQQVAEIDVLVDESSGGNTPNFTQRVEADQLTWTEALALAKDWKREYDEAVQRNVNRIMRVNEGWATIGELFTNPDRSFYKDVLNALSNADRERLNEIRQEIITLAKAIDPTTEQKGTGK